MTPFRSSTACALALAAAALPALARADVDVQIYDRTTGSTLPVYAADGRSYVVGEPRHEYELRLQNRSGERVMAVISVDGVNVITGQTAATGQSGYVLGPWASASIDGWRKSLDRAAAFYFTRLPDSYAARTGRPNDVGVIGVAVFRERPPPPVERRELEDRMQQAPAPSAAASADAQEATAGARAKRDSAGKAERLGTGHGRSLDSRVAWTDFERASDTPDRITAIYYDSRRNLVALGVLPPERLAREPRPFPAHFVPDP